MRILAYALVVLSALLSTGGVAIRSSADPANADAAKQPPTVQAVTQNKGDASPQICRPQPPNRVTTIPLRPRPEDSQAVELNTRGYNYQRPGETPRRPVVPTPPPAAPKN